MYSLESVSHVPFQKRHTHQESYQIGNEAKGSTLQSISLSCMRESDETRSAAGNSRQGITHITSRTTRQTQGPGQNFRTHMHALAHLPSDILFHDNHHTLVGSDHESHFHVDDHCIRDAAEEGGERLSE